MSETGYKISRTVSVTDEDIKETENYLKYHSFYAKLLKLDKYEQDYFGGGERVDIHSESSLAHASQCCP